ncbi:MAG: isocitrate/isopropylmalate dehydrogenase family protein [Chloroflexota bacterium]|nr:isocitrate/isopropylmalate dehydrogenase family protein [Chloroflexota bacterium]
MSRAYRIAVIGGDGIGPEVTEAALTVLDAAERRFGFRTERTSVDWSAEKYTTGFRVTPEVIEPLRAYDAILLGAIGHPDAPRGLPEADIIFGLRRGFDLYVNLRPIVLYDDRLCALKGRSSKDIDIVVVRENTEDVYGRPVEVEAAGTANETVWSKMIFTRRGTERIVRYAFELARTRPRKHLTLVDKANALRLQDIYRRVLEEVGREFPDVEHDAMYVDACSMWMVLHPERFDTIVTTNLFGDIITDLGAAIVGGLGTGASGNIHPGAVSVFEPIHGSAPKYAGQGVASPVGAIGAVALMLDHVGERDAAKAVDRAIREGFGSGRIKGVEAGSGRTMDVAAGIARTVTEGT